MYKYLCGFLFFFIFNLSYGCAAHEASVFVSPNDAVHLTDSEAEIIQLRIERTTFDFPISLKDLERQSPLAHCYMGFMGREKNFDKNWEFFQISPSYALQAEITLPYDISGHKKNIVGLKIINFNGRKDAQTQ